MCPRFFLPHYLCPVNCCCFQKKVSPTWPLFIMWSARLSLIESGPSAWLITAHQRLALSRDGLVLYHHWDEEPCCNKRAGTTKYIYTKSTTLSVPSSELGLSPPQASVSPPFGWGGTLAREGVGGPNFGDWRKCFSLYSVAGTDKYSIYISAHILVRDGTGLAH